MRRVYISGFFDSKLMTPDYLKSKVAIAVPARDMYLPALILVDAAASTVEALLATKLMRTEDEWQTALEARVPGLRIQMCEGMSGTGSAHGAACVDRLIDLSVKQLGYVETHFLDAYKLFSGGMMHELDQRVWVMKQPALLELAKLVNAANREYLLNSQRLLEIQRRMLELRLFFAFGSHAPLSVVRHNVEILERLDQEATSLMIDAVDIKTRLQKLTGMQAKQQRFRTQAAAAERKRKQEEAAAAERLRQHAEIAAQQQQATQQQQAAANSNAGATTTTASAAAAPAPATSMTNPTPTPTTTTLDSNVLPESRHSEAPLERAKKRKRVAAGNKRHA